MEMLLYLSLFLTFLLSLLFFKRTSIPKANGSGGQLIPGPPKLPLIGNLHQLLGSLHHRALRELAAKHGPLMHLMLGEVSAIVISSPEVAREFLKTHDTKFASRPEIVAATTMTYGNADLLFSPYGAYWRQLRKLCVMELLSVKRVQSFHSIREEEVLKCMRAICSTGSSGSVAINLSALLHSLTNDMTARAAFGSKCEDKETYLAAMKEALKFGSGLCVADLFPSSWLIRLLSGIDFKIERCHQRIDKVLDRIIKEHKQRKTAETKAGGGGDAAAADENLLDVLCRLQAEGGADFALTNTTVKALIFDVFQAGSGSAASTLIWAMSELMRNPRVMKKAQEEVRAILGGKDNMTEKDIAQLSYLNLVIKEVLRLHPAAPLLVPRECTEACDVLGYRIPVKTRVIINAWGIGRDPKYWEEPDAFKPERFEGSAVDFRGGSFEFIPFGAGRRMCPGISFGVASMEVALAHLLYYFDWSLPGGMRPEELDMSEVAGLAARRKHELHLFAIPCVPLPMN